MLQYSVPLNSMLSICAFEEFHEQHIIVNLVIQYHVSDISSRIVWNIEEEKVYV